MRILVLQLAKCADVFQTLPIVNAIARTYPNAHLDLMVQSQLSEAGRLASGISNLLTFPSQELLEPMMADESCCGLSIQILEQYLEGWSKQKYDWILNLSFSPLSSYVADVLKSSESKVSGYSRHHDGFLNFPDDVSAYYYAQVGAGKSNRAHISEILSELALTSLCKEDFKFKENLSKDDISLFKRSQEVNGKYIVVQVGPGGGGKSLGVFKWKQSIRKLLGSYDGKVYLIGSDADSENSKNILAGETFDRCVDLVGKTSIDQLFYLCRRAELLLGCNDFLMSVGSLTQTPCLKISFQSDNFWETGPLSAGSRILAIRDEYDMASDRLVEEVNALLENKALGEGAYRVKNGDWNDPVKYEGVNQPNLDEFNWQLIKAMYLGESYPISDSFEFVTAVKRLSEIAQVGLQQVSSIYSALHRSEPLTATVSTNILDEVDHVIMAIYQLSVEVRPIIDWFQTQRIKIKPGPLRQIMADTEVAFRDLITVLKIYFIEEDLGIQQRECL